MRILVLVLVGAGLAGCIGPELERLDGEVGAYTIDMKNLEFSPRHLAVGVGSTVTWVNQESPAHTVTPYDAAHWGTPGSGDAPDTWLREGESWSFTFTEPGTYRYYCIPHAAATADGYQGMVGVIEVVEGAGDAPAASAAKTPGSAWPVDTAEIGRDAAEVPPAIGPRGPNAVTIDLHSSELTAEIAPGTTYTYWTFNGTVPGPMLRVREGDTVTVNHHNDASSIMTHNIDFHAVTGPGGGATMTIAAPGETATFTFKALRAGLYVYHCAFQDPPLHVAKGMYGLILVEPPGGLPPVDKEYYVVQGDLYSPFKASQKGHHTFDQDRALAEDPSFVVFNGRVDSLTGDRRLTAEVGDSVRLFVGNGGPNLVSSFHIIGEIFDRVWDQGAIVSEPQENVQTTLVPAGGAAMVEFDVEVPGDYFLVDHSLYRIHKGAFGILHVEGDPDPTLYREGA